MKNHTKLITLFVIMGFVVSACGVKGKPLPPLKRGEMNNQNQGNQKP